VPKVLSDKRGEIAFITLNRPDKRNAIDTETTTLNFIPFAARGGAVSDEAGIDAVAEVRQALGEPSAGSEP
jgi:hypothetical protein